MTEYNWDSIFELYAYEGLQHYLSISELKCAIQEDNPIQLANIIGSHKHAAIYALCHCFIKPPPLACIHFLVSRGTPLDRSFLHNPFQVSPMELLHSRFRFDEPNYQVIKPTIDLAKRAYHASLLKTA
jgi:hypothetical protein